MVLVAVLTLGGLAVVGIALTHIVLGPASIPGSIPVNATMDSEDRFYATIFLGYGLGLLWCMRAIDRRANFIRFLAAILFAGGVARVISMVLVGLPNALFQALTALEFLAPLTVWFLLRRISDRL
jgi:hypothetical protein